MPFNPPIPESNPRKTASTGLNALMQAETAIQMGLLPPSAVAICWLIGAWADHAFHQHWIAVFGIVFGAVSGLVGVIQMVFAAERRSRLGKDSAGNSGTGSAKP